MSLNKFKIILIYIMGFCYLISMPFVIDAKGNEVSFLESIFVALLATSLNLFMWSDWMHTYILDNGIKIKYENYQRLGIIIVLVFLFIIIKVV